MTYSKHFRRIAGLVALAAWLFALAVTHVHACQLAAPAHDQGCCDDEISFDAQCSAHCTLEEQAPFGDGLHIDDVACAAPVFRVDLPARAIAAAPEVAGPPPPLIFLTLRLRN